MLRPLRWLAVLLLVVVAACNYTSDVDAKAIEAAMQSYYDAVRQDDAATQAACWTAARQDEATRQAQAWSKRNKEGLKLTDFHVEDTPIANLKIVHYYLQVKDRNLPETKAALVENDVGTWRLREIR